jgi:hypothetical protein
MIMDMTFQVDSSSPIPQTPPSDLGISTNIEKPADFGISPLVKQCCMSDTNRCHCAGVLSFSASHSLMSLTHSPDGPGACQGLSLLPASVISSSDGVESSRAFSSKQWKFLS